jgi:hypothetical protein
LRGYTGRGLLGLRAGGTGTMKVIVLVITMFLFPNVEEEASFIYPTMEMCMQEMAKKEAELVGFPIERVEAKCELQDKQVAPPPTECVELVAKVSCVPVE